MLNVPEQHCFAFTVGFHWVLGEDQVGRMLTMKELKEREQNDRGKKCLIAFVLGKFVNS